MVAQLRCMCIKRITRVQFAITEKTLVYISVRQNHPPPKNSTQAMYYLTKNNKHITQPVY